MTLFTKILNGEIPGKIIYQDEKCFAIRDINPQAPVHVLLIPKKEIPSMNELIANDEGLMGHMMKKVAEIAKTEGIDQSGYRLVVNNGSNAGQTVSHIHLHIIGGRALGWPPG
ncbi:MAG: histidine triad nucleotide-binding protein [Bdellovibrionota bacterium]